MSRLLKKQSKKQEHIKTDELDVFKHTELLFEGKLGEFLNAAVSLFYGSWNKLPDQSHHTVSAAVIWAKEWILLKNKIKREEAMISKTG